MSYTNISATSRNNLEFSTSSVSLTSSVSSVSPSCTSLPKRLFCSLVSYMQDIAAQYQRIATVISRNRCATIAQKYSLALATANPTDKQ